MLKVTHLFTVCTVGLSFCLLANTSSASVANHIKSLRPYLQVAYVPSWVDAKGTASVQVGTGPSATPDTTFQLHSTTLAQGVSLGAGVVLPLTSKRWLSHLDLSLGYSLMAKFLVNGTQTMTVPAQSQVWQYRYQYHVKLNTLWVDSNFDLYQWQQATLFAGAGVDYSWIEMLDYQQTSVGTAPDNYVTFANHKQNAWIYHVNIGLSTHLSKHIKASISDHYFPYVPVQTGTGSTGYQPILPLKNHLSMNQIRMSLDYLF